MMRIERFSVFTGLIRTRSGARSDALGCASRLTRTVILLSIALFTPVLHAAPSQNDVFKSIQESMDKPQDFDYRPVYMLAGGGAIVVLLLLLNSRRKGNRRSPQALNSPAKLMKEILKEIPLNSGEVRQLKLMASSVESSTAEEINPLVLLLCPSVMARGLQRAGNKVDRKTVTTIVRKLREKGK